LAEAGFTTGAFLTSLRRLMRFETLTKTYLQAFSLILQVKPEVLGLSYKYLKQLGWLPLRPSNAAASFLLLASAELKQPLELNYVAKMVKIKPYTLSQGVSLIAEELKKCRSR